MSRILQGAKSKKYDQTQDESVSVNTQDNLKHITVQEVAGERAAMDTVSHGLFAFGSPIVAGAGTLGKKIVLPSHGASKGDILKPTSGAGIYQEVAIISVADANTVYISTPVGILPGDTIQIHKFVTPLYNSDGSISTSAPVGGATAANQVLEIAQLTAINNNTDGLETLATAGNASLSSIDGKTPTLVGGKVPVTTDGLTDTQLRASPVPVTGPLTDTQLRATPVPVSGTVAVTGVATAANQTSQITQETAINTVLGLQADTAATSDTGTFSIVAFIKRGLQNWTSLLAKIPAIGTQLRAASMSISLASDTNLVSTNNSSTTPLAANGVFTGTSDNVVGYAEAKIYIISNVASATNGLSIQQSNDGTNWDVIDTYTIAAATAKTFGVGIDGSFFRIIYTNGATLQTSFRLQIVYHAFRTKPSTVRPQDARDNENDMEETLGYGMGFNNTTWDRIRSGVLGAVSSVIGYQNMIWVGKYNTSAPTLTNGQLIEPQFDVNGNLKIAQSTVAKNTNGTIVNTTLSATTATSNTAPANAVGFFIEANSDNTNNIRWAIGSTASATVGSRLEPGRSGDGFIPCTGSVSVCAEVSGTNAYQLQWILTA